MVVWLGPQVGRWANAKFIPWTLSDVFPQQTTGQINTTLKLLFYATEFRADKIMFCQKPLKNINFSTKHVYRKHEDLFFFHWKNALVLILCLLYIEGT